jgi:hypothetical protein
MAGLVGDSNGSTNEDDYAVELMEGKRKILERGIKDRRSRSTLYKWKVTY